MKRFFLALAIVLCFAGQARATNLSVAAAALQPGNWVELPTTNISSTWSATGASGFISGYATELAWDPKRRKLHYVGMDHREQIRHVALTESTNTWAIVANPPSFFGPPCLPDDCPPSASHQYDHQAIDKVRGKLYFRYTFSSNQLYEYDLATGGTNWTTIAANNQYLNTQCCGAIEFVEWLGGIVWVQPQGGSSTHASVTLWNRATNTWSIVGLSSGYDLEGYINPFLECSDTIKICIFGSGDNGQGLKTQKLYKIEKNYVTGAVSVTTLPDAPFPVGVHAGAIVVADPVSGRFLVLREGVKEFWEFDVQANGGTGQWTQLSSAGISDFVWNRTFGQYSIHGVQGGAIDAYGVITFVSCQQGANPCRMYLYKHNVAAQTFAQKCAQPGVIRCMPFDSSNELVISHLNTAACVAALGTSPQGFWPVPAGPTAPNVLARDYGTGVCDYPIIDTTQKFEGAGALRFKILAEETQNSDYLEDSFDRSEPAPWDYIAPGSPLGNVFWAQWYERWDQNYIDNLLLYDCGFGPNGNGCGYKRLIFFGNQPDGQSSSALELTTITYESVAAAPVWYGQAGTNDLGQQDYRGCSFSDVGDTQPGNFPELYTEPPCVRGVANVWRQHTIRVEVKPPTNTPVSSVEYWIDGQKVIHVNNHQVNYVAGSSTGNNGYGSFTVNAVMNGKIASPGVPDAHFWFDSFIVSTQPIAMSGIPAGEGGGDPPASGGGVIKRKVIIKLL